MNSKKAFPVAYQNQSATRGPRGDGGKDGSKENRHQEAKAGDDGGKTRPSALSNTSTALNKRGDGRTAEQRAHRDAKGVGTISDGRPRKVSVLAPRLIAEARHGIQGGSAVDDVDVEESE